MFLVNAMDIPIEMDTPKFISRQSVSPAGAQIGKEEILQVQDDFTEEKIKQVILGIVHVQAVGRGTGNHIGCRMPR